LEWAMTPFDSYTTAKKAAMLDAIEEREAG
jgi:hypothetical protein